MYADIINAQLFYFPCPFCRVFYRDKVCLYFRAVIAASLNAFFNSRIAGSSENAHDVRACLCRDLYFCAAGIHYLHVSHDCFFRESFAQLPDSIQAFALYERRACFYPVRAALYRFLSAFHRAAHIYKIQRYLQYRLHINLL